MLNTEIVRARRILEGALARNAQGGTRCLRADIDQAERILTKALRDPKLADVQPPSPAVAPAAQAPPMSSKEDGWRHIAHLLKLLQAEDSEVAPPPQPTPAPPAPPAPSAGAERADAEKSLLTNAREQVASDDAAKRAEIDRLHEELRKLGAGPVTREKALRIPELAARRVLAAGPGPALEPVLVDRGRGRAFDGDLNAAWAAKHGGAAATTRR